MHCGGSLSNHIKFYSFVFMHNISTRVVCGNGKHPLKPITRIFYNPGE